MPPKKKDIGRYSTVQKRERKYYSRKKANAEQEKKVDKETSDENINLAMEALETRVATANRKQKAKEKKQVAMKEQRRQRDEGDHSAVEKNKLPEESDLESDLAAARTTPIEESQKDLTSRVSKLEQELDECRQKLIESERKNKQFESEVKSFRSELDKAHEKLQNEGRTQRMLHNVIQESKGNIRILVRIRPPSQANPTGIKNDLPSRINVHNNKIIELEKRNEGVTSVKKEGSTGKLAFSFERVFLPSSSQEEVFKEVSQLVQSSLDGFKVCILCYGQQGSGKTYTMVGGEGEKGITQRAAEKFFSSIENLNDRGWHHNVDVSFLEVHNDKIKDLLDQNASGYTKHVIKMVGPNKNEVVVTNLTYSRVMDNNELRNLLRMASEKRSVAAAKCTNRSSSGHAFFTMKISGSNVETKESRGGILNLIDLAGSERPKHSHDTRHQDKQNVESLGQVIISLINKEAQVPQRNSQLTRLMQDCLRGSKILMFVNISPEEDCYQETLNSLRFASQVKECIVGGLRE